MQDFETWCQDTIIKSSSKGGAIRRMFAAFFKERRFGPGTPKTQIIKLLDEETRWLGIDRIDDDDIAYCMGVSLSTVRRARTTTSKEEVETSKNRGRPKILDEKAEAELVAWIKKESSKGHDPTRTEVTSKAQELLDRAEKDTTLSRHWIDSFLKTNCSPIQQSTVKPIEEERFEVKVGIIEEYFDLLANMNVTSIAPCLFINLDEVGFGSTTMKEAHKKVVIRTVDAESEPFYKAERAANHITAICSIAASGDILKSTIIGTNQNLKEDASKCTFYGNITYRSSKNAFITNEIYKEYIVDTIIPYIKRKRSQLSSDKHKAILIVDGHKSHFSDDILAILAENHIEYISIPPHSSHLLQPLDRHFFSEVKRFYRQKSPNSNLCAFTANIERIYIAIQQAGIPSTIHSSFKRAGIVPDINEGIATSLIIQKNRVISERTGTLYESPEDSDEAAAPETPPKSKIKKTGSTRWGLWNAEQLLRKERGECPLCGQTFLKEYKQ